MPQYTSTTDTWGLYSANAAYNAMQASLAIRPTHGLVFNVNYTWSKEMDDAGTIRTGYPIPAAQNATGKAWKADRMDRSLSTIDSPQNIAIYGDYKLPFGKGHIGSSHFLVRAIAGGWTFSSIAYLRLGVSAYALLLVLYGQHAAQPGHLHAGPQPQLLRPHHDRPHGVRESRPSPWAPSRISRVATPTTPPPARVATSATPPRAMV